MITAQDETILPNKWQASRLAAIKKEYITFIFGAGLSAAGLTAIPASEAFLTVGSALISLSYGILLLRARAGTQLGKAPAPAVSTAPPAYTSPTPPQAHPPSTPAAQSTPPPQAPSMPLAPAAPAAKAPQASTLPSAATPSPPSAPTMKQPKSPGRKLPSVKAPHITLPEPVIENRVPIALLGVGLILVVVAVAITFGSAAAFFWGVFIPGILFLGLGGGLLFLRLNRRPGPVVVELRRFCMHCGFQMSSGDVYCGRCHRQPPSGVDTKVCPNCGAVIPTLAKFCRDCGAGQPVTP